MDIISVFFNMKICCVFSLESPHRGDSNEYTQYTIFNVKKKIDLIYPKSVAVDFCSKVLENEFIISVVNEPSVFEPLRFYCTCMQELNKFDFFCKMKEQATLRMNEWLRILVKMIFMQNCVTRFLCHFNNKPTIAVMHSPHSLVRFSD